VAGARHRVTGHQGELGPAGSETAILAFTEAAATIWENSMRLSAPTVIAALLLAGGTPPAMAFSGTMPLGTRNAAFTATLVADETSDRASFTAKAEAEMQEWQKKLDAAATTAKAKGEEGKTEASRDLDAAWAKTKVASKQLKTASAEGWDRARAGFEKAEQNLAAEWHKVYPGTK
jgi:hypothetical protein